jgi:hypothetical protein
MWRKVLPWLKASSGTISLSRPTNWKRKYGGMPVDEAKKLKAVEAENANLKKLVAEQALMIQGLKEISSKKW